MKKLIVVLTLTFFGCGNSLEKTKEAMRDEVDKACHTETGGRFLTFTDDKDLQRTACDRFNQCRVYDNDKSNAD